MTAVKDFESSPVEIDLGDRACDSPRAILWLRFGFEIGRGTEPAVVYVHKLGSSDGRSWLIPSEALRRAGQGATMTAPSEADLAAVVVAWLEEAGAHRAFSRGPGPTSKSSKD